MINKFLIFIMVLSFTAPASAQFRRSEPTPVPQSPSLECAIIRATEHDRRDPIYKITVSITLDDSGTLQEMLVQHSAASGTTYVRSEQYTQANIWQTPGREEWYWRGRRGQNTMLGELWHTADGRWFYSETLTVNGRLDYQMLSLCHLITG
jgi:hypothetical protein